MRSVVSMVLLALLLAAKPTSVLAFYYCTEPTAPSCASRYGSFDDEWEFDRCKREMNDYQSEVEAFVACNRSANEQAILEHNEAVKDFNGRAQQ
ncbi:MAG: hypothetical protein E5Y65_23250 [Mesorhizobium sp.]|uniref:hypothetical protein n=1 Tax=Mesorhizobium sp. TaxID=1871066 RepID=UPI001205CDC3|nr:hypothetical protein [Mesorhizobium sp.]TIL70286.1 MAG: hypothetical protein E5Y70_31650 [Mesorhizobium sp.]TIL87664.1 MAG: hypothetical protein E5Y65_23250 [Mesorhizobium sp.]TIL99126.1 MAG: hypothetical protein E5Y64_23020 [Mesorhizobium sp.]TIN21430.1 MAG: hypothetical protein E5Y59_01985 [Mesorhizobium sp.]